MIGKCISYLLKKTVDSDYLYLVYEYHLEIIDKGES